MSVRKRKSLGLACFRALVTLGGICWGAYFCAHFGKPSMLSHDNLVSLGVLVFGLVVFVIGLWCVQSNNPVLWAIIASIGFGTMAFSLLQLSNNDTFMSLVFIVTALAIIAVVALSEDHWLAIEKRIDGDAATRRDRLADNGDRKTTTSLEASPPTGWMDETLDRQSTH